MWFVLEPDGRVTLSRVTIFVQDVAASSIRLGDMMVESQSCLKATLWARARRYLFASWRCHEDWQMERGCHITYQEATTVVLKAAKHALGFHEHRNGRERGLLPDFREWPLPPQLWISVGNVYWIFTKSDVGEWGWGSLFGVSAIFVVWTWTICAMQQKKARARGRSLQSPTRANDINEHDIVLGRLARRPHT